MRTAYLLFLMIGFSALTPEIIYAKLSSQISRQLSEYAAKIVSNHPPDAEHATPAVDTKLQKDANAPRAQRGQRHISGENLQRSSITTPKARPKQLPNNREHFRSTDALNLHRRDFGRSAAVEGTSGPKKIINNTLPSRAGNVMRPTVSGLNNVRHRGANPPVIGGVANSHGRNAGAINGTGVRRRP